MISNERATSIRNGYSIYLLTIAVAILCILNFHCAKKKQVGSLQNTTSGIVSVDKNLLLGVWGTTPEENASFQILQDTIYYVEADRRLKYEVSGNIFVCFEENGDTNFICSINKLDKDSLVMENKRTDSKSGFIRLP